MLQLLLFFLPIAAFLLVWICRVGTISSLGSVGFAFLEASAIWGSLVVIATESLSLFGVLQARTLTLFWSVACAGAFLLILRCRNTGRSLFRDVFALFAPSKYSLIVWSILIYVGVLLLGTLITALVAAPNTADSMTYHMSRIAHWAQNGSVAHYPTNILRQLFQCPWAEFAIAQFYILTASDSSANLIQWFAFPSSLIAIALLSKEIGLGRIGTLTAVVFFATTPMTLLQASTTQTDLVCAFWMLSMAVFAFAYLRTGALSFIFMTGLTLGLAVNTKQTSLMFAFPLSIGFTVAAFRRFGRQSIPHLMLIGLVLLGVNAGHWTRNYTLFGSALGVNSRSAEATLDGQLSNYRNEHLTAPLFVSNIIRNVALHIGTPFPRLNTVIEQGIKNAHLYLGVGLVDSRNNAVPDEPYRFQGLSSNEDIAGNPLHAVLIFIFIVAFLFAGIFRNRTHLVYSMSLATGFLIFCATIKWMPYHTRLHLPLIALASPLIGPLISKRGFRLPVCALLVVTAVTSIYWIGWSPFRPWTGPNSIWQLSRNEQYFANRPHLTESYLSLAAEAKRRHWINIGLLARHSDFEYPLFALLKETGVRIEHLDVPNPSQRLNRPNFRPDVIVVTGLRGRLNTDSLKALSEKYKHKAVIGSLYILYESTA